MKTILMFSLLVVFSVIALTSQQAFAQDEMSKDQWQAEMTRLNSRVTDLQTQVSNLDKDVANLKSQSEKLTADLRSCEDALYAMLGVTREEVEAFDKELTDMEARVAELQRMSDEELMNHRDEINRMNARLAEMSKSKIAMIPRYGSRVASLQEKVNALMQSAGKGGTYTVGTWSRDRDCLWNIAKKRDVYNNAWLWPKIWQGNRDKIKDPDVIQPRWVLKIPQGGELSQEERSAANRYYRQKATAAEPAGGAQ